MALPPRSKVCGRLFFLSGVLSVVKALPPEFGPTASFFVRENGRPAVMDGGKFWVLGPAGKVEVPDSPLLTGEEPFVRAISKERALELAAIREA